MKTTPVALAALALAACPPAAEVDSRAKARPAAVSIRVEERSPFDVIRRAPAPAFGAGGLTVFASASAADGETGLPGVALGTVRGPMYGLLSGYFAPQIVAARSTIAYDLIATTGRDALELDFRPPDSSRGAGLLVRVFAPEAGRVRLVTDGPATLTFMAARTSVQGTHQGRPSFSVQASAGDRPSIRYFRGTELVVESPRFGPVAIEHGCPRSTLIHPTPRGSTSVFVLRVGPDPGHVDESYAPIEDVPMPADRNDCVSKSATITFPWPPPN